MKSQKTATPLRFEFGENWRRFLHTLDEESIRSAETSLKANLGLSSMVGMKFLDIGSGSGLFSLAARRLGAQVHSFDYDPKSVSCTQSLKNKYFQGDESWSVERGSVLDVNYMERFQNFDIVYSWGVLHHTGDMKLALMNASACVKPEGKIFIAIYNDQGLVSWYWLVIKKIFNSGSLGKAVVIIFHFPYLFMLRYLWRAIKGKGRVERGMSIWYDMIDWLGGMPFEVASSAKIVGIFTSWGFEASKVNTVGHRMGCNEFIFIRITANQNRPYGKY